jgi:hypothetical protein
LILVEAAHLARVALEHRVAQGHLPVTADRHPAARRTEMIVVP